MRETAEDSHRPALRLGNRGELTALLQEAAELEHGLCCSYLFAAFSLRVGDTPQRNREVVATAGAG